MEVLVYLALGILTAPYILMGLAALKLHLAEIKNRGETALDLTESA